ncbi:uncharacterized protein RSE6_00728 [Rhynchosporium secalis]|uniref:Uncharacterized protein n=1 Tax=Rhynchosporium secalis TaxID=38038 RepID=A0A1E1LVZ1_RHYSE|nr:uncharacterized protein RSE6_00728 [Rhynchosporium secalis]
MPADVPNSSPGHRGASPDAGEAGKSFFELFTLLNANRIAMKNILGLLWRPCGHGIVSQLLDAVIPTASSYPLSKGWLEKIWRKRKVPSLALT